MYYEYTLLLLHQALEIKTGYLAGSPIKPCSESSYCYCVYVVCSIPQKLSQCVLHFNVCMHVHSFWDCMFRMLTKRLYEYELSETADTFICTDEWHFKVQYIHSHRVALENRYFPTKQTTFTFRDKMEWLHMPVKAWWSRNTPGAEVWLTVLHHYLSFYIVRKQLWR